MYVQQVADSLRQGQVYVSINRLVAHDQLTSKVQSAVVILISSLLFQLLVPPAPQLLGCIPSHASCFQQISECGDHQWYPVPH